MYENHTFSICEQIKASEIPSVVAEYSGHIFSFQVCDKPVRNIYRSERMDCVFSVWEAEWPKLSSDRGAAGAMKEMSK